MGLCPICGRAAAARAQNAAFPFCSPRCKQIDLGKWLDERYRLPASAEEPDGEGAGGATAPGSMDSEKA